MSALKTDLSELTIADGRYAVGGKLGIGSMGHVFRAFDTRLKTNVVIKVPTDRRLADPEFHQRFLQESRLLTQLNHPRIVKILDVGEHEDVPFFVMPFIDGGNLLDRMRDAEGKLRALPPHSLKDWLGGVAEALDFMHSKGYIHRDVKPANILFDAHGHVYLSDFGLSKILMDPEHESSGLTAANAVVGTPNYVAPELVLARRDYDGRVDQYSLAVTVYEVLSGKAPFEGGSPTATMVNQTTRHPALLHEVRPDVSEELASAVRMAMSKRPWKRFESCRAFAEAALSCLPQNSDSALTASSRSSSTGYSTVIERRPDILVAGASRGTTRVLPCPACGEKLVLKAKYAGQRGSCVHCGARLEISQNLHQIRLLKSVGGANGAVSKEPAMTPKSRPAIAPKTRTSIAQELPPKEVFGIRFTSRRSMWLVLAGLLLLLFGAVLVGRQSAQWDRGDEPPRVHVSNHSPE